MGDVILVQEVMSETLRERRMNRQPPTWKGMVTEVPAEDGSGHLGIDTGGEYGVITLAARNLNVDFTWKPYAGRADTAYNGKRSDVVMVVGSIQQEARECQVEGLTQEQANKVLTSLRDLAQHHEDTHLPPDLRSFIDGFTLLDKSLTAGFKPPSDWQ
ncbi:hypothetical protein ACFW2V_13890 [Streptomyces sp. NPDC058947]|uniref:hypothetical protein n=1 Tax=Streptomyces sp. NPDC058947 TaxID=3346675 RepID=UPI0036AE40BB